MERPSNIPSKQALNYISLNELKISGQIGQGGFAKVYKGTWKNAEVAIKQMHLSTPSNSAKEEFINEAKFMVECSFPNIVRLFGICMDNHFTMVMEYLPKGSLYQVLQNEKELGWETRWKITGDISVGLDFLHQKNIVHGDLKSLNVLLASDYTAKIGDFGLAKMKLETNNTITQGNKSAQGSVRWKAPERFYLKTATATKASDIYSYGMIMWEIAACQIPYSKESDDFLIMNWIKNNEQEEIPADCPEDYAKLIKHCRALDPTRRPSAKEVAEQLSKLIDKPKTDGKNFLALEDMQTEIMSSHLASGEKEFEEGLNYFRKCEFPKALQSFEESAKLYFPPAFLRLGWMYSISGCAGPKDQDKSKTYYAKAIDAIKWFQKRTASGSALDEYHLALCYEQSNQLKLAFDCYSSSANKNNPEAQYALGLCYEEGKGVEKNAELSLKCYQLAAEQNLADAQNSLGLRYEESNEPKKAVEYYYSAAKQGLSDAQYNLGDCYFYGKGVEKNLSKALEFFELAAKQGNAKAQNELGVCYEQGKGVVKNLEQAFKCYQLAASQELAEAQHHLGSCYEYGIGVKKDLSKAFKLYQSAAVKGDAAAQYSLALYYEDAKGTSRDLKEAIRFYQAAAEQGNAYAQYRLGYFYEVGKEVEKDKKQSNYFYDKAHEQFQLEAAKGDFEAQYYLAECYRDGKGVAKDEAKAFQYAKISAQAGNLEAQNLLGECYQHGIGVIQNLKKAFECYLEAANKGSAEAQYHLGYCFEEGVGVEKNQEQALKHYRLAAEQNYAPAQFCLGKYYHKKNDMEQAISYYQLAADQEHSEAQYELASCYQNGNGLSKDLTKAIQLYEAAAKQGNVDAQYSLGDIFLTGKKGKHRDFKKAFSYFTLAAEQNHLTAMNDLAYCYEDGKGVEKNIKEAIKYYQQAAKAGDSVAHYHLGRCYEAGKGVAKDYEKAIEHYYFSCQKGEKNAELALNTLLDHHPKYQKKLDELSPQNNNNNNNNSSKLIIPPISPNALIEHLSQSKSESLSEKQIDDYLKSGIKLETKDDKGCTALHWAAFYGEKEVVAILLKKNSKLVNELNDAQQTALHIACQKGREEVVRLLLREMVFHSQKDNLGKTALNYAEENKDKRIIRLIEDKKEATQELRWVANLTMIYGSSEHLIPAENHLLLRERAVNLEKQFPQKNNNYVAAQIGFFYAEKKTKSYGFYSFDITGKQEYIHVSTEYSNYEFSNREEFLKDLERYHPEQIGKIKKLSKKDFPRKFHHSERGFFKHLENKKNVEGYVQNFANQLKKEKGLTPSDVNIKLVTLDLHSTHYLCNWCEPALQYFHSKRSIFFGLLKENLDKTTFQISKSFYIMSRVSAEKPTSKQKPKTLTEHEGAHEPVDIRSYKKSGICLIMQRDDKEVCGEFKPTSIATSTNPISLKPIQDSTALFKNSNNKRKDGDDNNNNNNASTPKKNKK